MYIDKIKVFPTTPHRESQTTIFDFVLDNLLRLELQADDEGLALYYSGILIATYASMKEAKGFMLILEEKDWHDKKRGAICNLIQTLAEAVQAN